MSAKKAELYTYIREKGLASVSQFSELSGVSYSTLRDRFKSVKKREEFDTLVYGCLWRLENEKPVNYIEI